jgi:leucyl aminopeptidase
MRGLILAYLWGTAHLATAVPDDPQHVLAPAPDIPSGWPQHGDYTVPDDVLAALNEYSDPVAAFVALQPEAEAVLSEPRLLQIIGESKPEWMTEGDKLRLRRQVKKFIDITDHAEFYAELVHEASAGKPSKLALFLWAVSDTG